MEEGNSNNYLNNHDFVYEPAFNFADPYNHVIFLLLFAKQYSRMLSNLDINEDDW